MFEAAARLPSAERSTFLDGACLGDAPLRQRLEALLAAHDEPDRLLPEDAAEAAATIKLNLDDLPVEAVGQTIGRYKLLEKVGEGGCGVVYVADQEQPVRRRVALKIVKLGMDTRQVVARFEAERQALALMDHPNIAKVLDAGTTEVGRPYFVMELVRGIRITDYCDQNHLSTAERLSLFVKVCHAIQHAHQKGIIHRDIKPSNILVTLHDGVPVPKVIDFGIAKATEGRLTDATVYTQLHQFIGTPAYMSPEQAEMSGLDVDTRSDIYSLGVLLYELLVGKTPFDARELMASGIDQMRKTIREQEPVRPSTKVGTLQGDELTTTAKRRAVETSRLANLLRGDLDWIVMKCLEKDRTRRYDTANGLAQDLERHLHNEPVIARPPSTFYRLHKLYRRNKLAFAAAMAVAAALCLGVIASTWQAVRATRAQREALQSQAREAVQRQQADAARSQAEGLVTFMMQDLQPALAKYGRLPLLKQTVEKAIEYYEGLPADLRNLTTDFGLADSTEALGEVLRASGDNKGAEATFNKALALYQAIAAKNPDIPEALATVLRVEVELSTLTMATSPIPAAERDARQQDFLRRWRELSERYPMNLAVSRGLMGMLLTRAQVAAYMFNKPQDALAAGLEADSRIKALLAANPDSRELAGAAAECKVSLAAAYEALGQQEKSAQLSEEAAAYFDEALKADPANLDLLARAATAEKFLSYRVSPISQKRSRDAELVARERYRLLVELDPSNADWRYNFAMAHMMECYYLESAGQIEAARTALKKFDSLLEPVSTWAVDRELLMNIRVELARLAGLVGDTNDDTAQIATVESRFKDHNDNLPIGSFDRIQARIRWLYAESRAYLSLRDWPELARVSRQAITAVETGLARQPGDTELLLRQAVAGGFLGIALLRQLNPREATVLLQQAQTGYREIPAVAAFKEDRESFSALVIEALAETAVAAGDTQQARQLYESVVTRGEAKLANDPDNWELKEAVAGPSVELAGLMDLSKPEEAARRQSLLNRAATLLSGPGTQSRLTTDDKDVLAKLALLRSTSETK